MKTSLGVLILSLLPASAFAVFSAVPTPAPEPGILELVGLAGGVLVVVRLLRRKK